MPLISCVSAAAVPVFGTAAAFCHLFRFRRPKNRDGGSTLGTDSWENAVEKRIFGGMYPKFIIMAFPDRPLAGTFIYGKVYNHCDLAKGYGKVYGGGWYEKDDEKKTMLLYGASGDYGEPALEFLSRIPRSLKGYAFYYAADPNDRPEPLDVSSVEWI